MASELDNILNEIANSKPSKASPTMPKQQSISNKTSKPIKPKPLEGNDDELDNILSEIAGGGTTTTTTTTVPETTEPTVGKKKPSFFKDARDNLQNEITKIENELFASYTPEEIEKIKKGTKRIFGKDQSLAEKALGAIGGGMDWVTNATWNYGLLPTLQTIDYIDNTVPALVEGSIKNIKVIKSGDEARYKSISNIPIHKQSGLPIAKVGDLELANPDAITEFKIDVPAGAKFMPDNIALARTQSLVAKFGEKSKTEKYTKESEIPLHVQTLKPIAKVGDYKFDNEFAVANMAINNDENYILPSETYSILEEQKKLVGKNKRAIVDFADVSERAKQPKFGWGSIEEFQTGNKWVDRVMGFVGDVVGSPSTYVSAGSATPAKLALEPLERGGLEIVETVVKQLDDDLRRVSLGYLKKGPALDNALTRATELVAQELGETITKKQLRRISTAVVREAANVLKVNYDNVVKGFTSRTLQGTAARGLERAAIAKQFSKYADNMWNAIGPRRVLGATSREAVANSLRELRDEAVRVAAENPYTQTGRAAKIFVDSMSDDVIGKIATKGYAAFSDELVVNGVKTTVGEALGLPSGLRFGYGGAKVSIPVPRIAQKAVGEATYGLRKLGTKAGRVTEFVPGIRKSLLELVTPLGRNGIPLSNDLVFESRVGLRSGTLTGTKAVQALEILAEDQIFKAYKKTAYNTLRKGLEELLAEYPDKELRRTVYQLLEVEDGLLLYHLSTETADFAAAEFSRILGREVTAQEVEFARAISAYLQQLGDILMHEGFFLGSYVLGAPNIPGGLQQYVFVKPSRVLTDKAATFLGEKHSVRKFFGGKTRDQLIDETLLSLGYQARLLPTERILNDIKPETVWFGRRLSEDIFDEAGNQIQEITVPFLNKLAKERLGITFDILDSDVSTMLARQVEKFSNDYALVKRLRRLKRVGTQTYRTDRPIFNAERFTDIENVNIADELLTFADGIKRELPSYGYNYSPQMPSILDERLGILAQRLGFDNVTTARIAVEVDNLVSMGVARNQAVVDVIQKYRLIQSLQDWSNDAISSALLKIATRIDNINSKLTGTGRMGPNETAVSLAADARDLTDIGSILMDLQGMRGDASFAYSQMGGIVPYNTLMAEQFLAHDIANKYVSLFARPMQDTNYFIENLNPRLLSSMVDVAQDAFVALDSTIVPDLQVRADIALMLGNVAKLKNPTYAGRALRVLKDINRFVKTWVVSTPGFHIRNGVSNLFQLIMAGAELKNVSDAVVLATKWNKFLEEEAALGITRVGAIYVDSADTFDDLVDRFIEREAIPAAKQDAFRRTVLDTGSTGLSEIEEVFSGVVPEKTGVIGKAVRSRGRDVPPDAGLPARAKAAAGRAVEATSETLGAIPRFYRRKAAPIEDFSRFALTYDGLQQGLTPAQAAARTKRFLFDYEDLSTLDENMKSIIPFWIWMSRNLPLQLQEFFFNPKIYAQYRSFRNNFEDEEGNNMLMPSYLKQAGVIPIGGKYVLRPDIGLFGTGTPSPLGEIAASGDVSGILRSAPAYNLASIWFGKDPYTGRELDTAEKIQEATQQLVPPLGTAGRYLGAVPGIGAGTDWGPLSGLQKYLGVRGPSKAGASSEEMQRRALLSLLGVPLTTVGPNEELAALYEQRARLEEARKNTERK